MKVKVSKVAIHFWCPVPVEVRTNTQKQIDHKITPQCVIFGAVYQTKSRRVTQTYREAFLGSNDPTTKGKVSWRCFLNVIMAARWSNLSEPTTAHGALLGTFLARHQGIRS